MSSARKRIALPQDRVHCRAVLLVMLGTFVSGCTFTPGGIGLPEAGIDMTVTGTAPASDPVDRAALAALNEGASRWQERASGAEGTVEALGAVDPKGCVPARLLVHDYTGVRMEDRRLCPGGTSEGSLAAVPPSDNVSPPDPPVAAAMEDEPATI